MCPNFLPMTNPPDYLNVAQAAAELRITERAVRHRIKAGTLPASKLGNGRTSAYVITREALEAARNQDAA